MSNIYTLAPYTCVVDMIIAHLAANGDERPGRGNRARLERGLRLEDTLVRAEGLDRADLCDKDRRICCDGNVLWLRVGRCRRRPVARQCIALV